MNITIKYKRFSSHSGDAENCIILGCDCLNASHPDVFFNSYNVHISVKHNKALFLKITFKATCFSSIELKHVVVKVDFGCVHWKGLMMALKS
jgi:hypothetical protein